MTAAPFLGDTEQMGSENYWLNLHRVIILMVFALVGFFSDGQIELNRQPFKHKCWLSYVTWDVYENFPMLLKNDGHHNNYKCQDSEDGIWCKNYVFGYDQCGYLLCSY